MHKQTRDTCRPLARLIATDADFNVRHGRSKENKR